MPASRIGPPKVVQSPRVEQSVDRISSGPTPPAVPPANSPGSTPAAPVDSSHQPHRRLTNPLPQALKLNLDLSSGTHSGKFTFGDRLIQGNVKITEQIGLPGTAAHRSLVESDRLRSQYEQTVPHTVWVKTAVLSGASADFPVGLGGTLGLSGNVEITSIAAHQVDQGQDLVLAVANQAKAMAVSFDAAGLNQLNPAPGTEWMFRAQAEAPLSAGPSIGDSISAGLASVTALASATLTATASQTVTKNVKILPDKKVYVHIARSSAAEADANVAARAGFKDFLGLVKHVDAGASLGLTRSVGHEVLGAAVVDLNTEKGRAAFDYLMRALPADAAHFITEQNLGGQYTGTTTAKVKSADFHIGKLDLVAASTTRGTAHGVVIDDGATTLLGEAEYAKVLKGSLLKLALGEERTVNVRAGSAVRDGQEERVIALSLDVKDRNLTQSELGQLLRLAEAMGQPLQGFSTGSDGGKASYQIDLALNDAQVAQLSGWDSQSIRFAFAHAQRELAGLTTLPPWYEHQAAFAWYKEQFVQPGKSDQAPAVSAAYAEQFPGRSLEQDIASEQAVSRVEEQLDKVRGKAVTKWGKTLEAVGRQSNADLRASMVALRRLAGAEVVRFTLTAQGHTASLEPQTKASQSVADVVGTVLSPPDE